MRTLVFGVLGILLLLCGLLAGVGGVGLQLTDPCSPKYRLTLQPADAVADPPDRTVSMASLSEYQRTAVEAAADNRTRLRFTDRARLEPLTEVVIAREGGRYVADVVTEPCRSIYDELTIGGFTVALVGFFSTLYAVVAWRMS